MYPKRRNAPRNSALVGPYPAAYLITFTCYGTHLYGHQGTSVTKDNNLFDTPPEPPSRNRERALRKRLKQAAYYLDSKRRKIVIGAIIERCLQRSWDLLAAHVRTEHVHVVVEAEASPQRVCTDLKGYASRLLNNSGLDSQGRRRWTKGCSGRYLWRESDVSAAVEYVVSGQGIPMQIFLRSED